MVLFRAYYVASDERSDEPGERRREGEKEGELVGCEELINNNERRGDIVSADKVETKKNKGSTCN